MKKVHVCLFMGLVFVSNASSAADDYTIVGPVNAITSQSSKVWPCHISLSIPGGYYDRKFQAASNADICATARLAYITGEDVKLHVNVDNSSDVNNIDTITFPAK